MWACRADKKVGQLSSLYSAPREGANGSFAVSADARQLCDESYTSALHADNESGGTPAAAQKFLLTGQGKPIRT